MKEKIIENLIYLRLLTQYKEIFRPFKKNQKILYSNRASFLENQKCCYESYKMPLVKTTQYVSSIMDSLESRYSMKDVISIFCLNIKNFFKGQNVALKRPQILIKTGHDFSKEYICLIDVYVLKDGEELI
jgi:hypothetical protein